MRVERDQPDLVERHAEAVRAGPGDGIVAAEQQGQPVRGGAARDRVADRREAFGWHHTVERHVAGVADRAVELERRFRDHRC